MTKPSAITQDRLNDLLSYDPETGLFTRRVGRKGVSAGSIAGCENKDGYILIGIDGERPYAHRLAFLAMTGEWPQHQVDHINGVKTDNRWANLRDVTPQHNMQNRTTPAKTANRQSKFLGVTNNGFSWQAQIRNGEGKKIHLGSFATEEAAFSAYLAVKRLLHPGNTL